MCVKDIMRVKNVKEKKCQRDHARKKCYVCERYCRDSVPAAARWKKKVCVKRILLYVLLQGGGRELEKQKKSKRDLVVMVTPASCAKNKILRGFRV